MSFSPSLPSKMQISNGNYKSVIKIENGIFDISNYTIAPSGLAPPSDNGDNEANLSFGTITINGQTLDIAANLSPYEAILAVPGGNYSGAGSAKLDLSFANKNISNADFYIAGGAILDVAGAATLSSTLDVTGAATLNSTLGVTGAASLSSTLDVTGAASLSSTLDVTGAASLSSTLNVVGAATLSSTLDVSGAVSFNNGSNVTLDTGDLLLGSASLKQQINLINNVASYLANYFNSTSTALFGYATIATL